MRTITITIVLAATLAPRLAAATSTSPTSTTPASTSSQENPTPSAVAAGLDRPAHRQPRATTRPPTATSSQLGILGREAYNFDAGGSRASSASCWPGTLNPGSPFGGNFWAAPYANIRLAQHRPRRRRRRSPSSRAEEQGGASAASRRRSRRSTCSRSISTRDTNGAVIDTDTSRSTMLGADRRQGRGARRDRAPARRRRDGADGRRRRVPVPAVERLRRLRHAGDVPQVQPRDPRARRGLPGGLRRRRSTALGESFIDDTGDRRELDVGVFHSYSTGTGDATNGLDQPEHLRPPVDRDGRDDERHGRRDLRFTRKVEDRPTMPGSAQGLTSNLAFTIYDEPGVAGADHPQRGADPAPRRGEVLHERPGGRGGRPRHRAHDLGWPGADRRRARPRTRSSPRCSTSAQYSLLFEGHRWIDARRFGRLDMLPLDKPDAHAQIAATRCRSPSATRGRARPRASSIASKRRSAIDPNGHRS